MWESDIKLKIDKRDKEHTGCDYNPTMTEYKKARIFRLFIFKNESNFVCETEQYLIYLFIYMEINVF